MTTLTFSKALTSLKEGCRVSRMAWKNRGLWISIQHPETNSAISEPFIIMKRQDNSIVPWTPTQSDILAKDWEVVR